MSNKIGRNDPCPCGSGKKYKKCCLNKPYEEQLAEAIQYSQQNIKNKARIKQCLHPNHDECDEKIIKAHAIQENKILKKVCENGMLITTDGTRFGMFQTTQLKGKGITSTFSGFCKYHDKVLFQEIEDKEFVCSQKQIFLLTYRTMCWHYQKKLEQINAQSIQYEKMLEKGFDLFQSKDFIEYNKGLRLGYEDNEKEKNSFDEILLKENYNNINYFVWEIPYEIKFTISMMHELEFDIEGNRINDLSLNKPVKKIYLNIFPLDNKSLCVWSWLKDNDRYFAPFSKQFEHLSVSDKENYFNNKLPRWSDSLIISPTLWNKWGEGIQQAFITHSNFDSLYRMMENETNAHKFEYMYTPWNLFERM